MEPAAAWTPLYPEAVRRRDLLTVAAGIARYVRSQGYWPRVGELGLLLKAPKFVVWNCLQELVASKHIERISVYNGSNRYRLNSAGWALLGYEPLEPWRKPPTQKMIRRLTNAAASRAMRMEQAALRHQEQSA